MIAMSRQMLIAGSGALVSVAAIGVMVWQAARNQAPVPPVRPVTLEPAKPVEAAPPAAAAAQRPSFDIVRVEPTGETVVAGRATPGSTVTLMASGKPAGSVTADGSGQFVIIPDALKPGAHELSLQQRDSQGDKPSAQSVAVSVPDKGGKKEVIVALAEPGKPTQVLSDGKPALAPAPATPGAVAAPTFRTVEAEQGGGFFATGQAQPGAKLRIYLNDAFIAEVVADAVGQWALRVSRGMTAGQYAVRADQVDPATGRIAARAEVAFAYAPQIAIVEPAPGASAGPPVRTAVAAAPPAAPAAATPAEPSQGKAPDAAAQSAAGTAAPALVTIKHIATTNVERGDSLWRISRRILGQGVRYSHIYDANTAQIRNPRLIYPGQILVVPMNTGSGRPDTAKQTTGPQSGQSPP